jgi:hypothetical protein
MHGESPFWNNTVANILRLVANILHSVANLLISTLCSSGKRHYNMKQKIFTEIISFLLTLLFVYAATAKLLEYPRFKDQLSVEPLIASYKNILAWLLPAVELGVAALLTVKNTRFYGLYASLILLIVFTGYIAGMLLSATSLPCSCGGVINGLSWKEHLLFNLFFIAISIAGIVLKRKEKYQVQTSQSPL